MIKKGAEHRNICNQMLQINSEGAEHRNIKISNNQPVNQHLAHIKLLVSNDDEEIEFNTKT